MKSITIIGTGEGISKGVAEKFGGEGFHINLISRTEAKLQKIVDELKSKDISADYAVADAGNAESLKNGLISLRDKNGHSDMILYNAAALDIKDFLEQDWETYKRTFEINIGGAFHLLKTVLPFCIQNNTGKLFFTNGGLALSGHPEWTTLTVGKAGLRNLIQSAQAKVKGTNVHIAQLTVCGYVNPDDEKYNPTAIAEQYWKLFNQQPNEFELEIMY